VALKSRLWTHHSSISRVQTQTTLKVRLGLNSWSVMSNQWCVHNRLFNTNFEEKFKWTPDTCRGIGCSFKFPAKVGLKSQLWTHYGSRIICLNLTFLHEWCVHNRLSPPTLTGNLNEHLILLKYPGNSKNSLLYCCSQNYGSKSFVCVVWEWGPSCRSKIDRSDLLKGRE
jgi:hypothetical protein